jgi:hypothetical protein
MKRIIIQEALKSGQIIKLKQDRCCEFISVLAYISAIGRWILLLLIYKGDFGDLISTWVNNVITDF